MLHSCHDVLARRESRQEVTCRILACLSSILSDTIICRSCFALVHVRRWRWRRRRLLLLVLVIVLLMLVVMVAVSLMLIGIRIAVSLSGISLTRSSP